MKFIGLLNLLKPGDFGIGFGVAVGEEGVADGVETVVIEFYRIIEDVTVFVLGISITSDFFIYVIISVRTVYYLAFNVINTIFNGLFCRISVNSCIS